MDVYVSLEEDFTYKTIELDDDLLDIIDKDEDGAFAVLCSNDKTFQLKKKNHSNTVLLGYHNYKDEEDVNEEIPNKTLITFSSFKSDFECKKILGDIDLSMLPIYDGSLESISLHNNLGWSMEELKENSPISNKEFMELYNENKGSEINGYACILADSLITKLLNWIIVTQQVISTEAGKDINENIYDDIGLNKLVDKVTNEGYTNELFKTILNKFGQSKSEYSNTYKLNNNKVAIWYGIESLKKYAQKLTSPQEFSINWKKSFPTFYNIPIELDWLQGNYCRPISNRIQYFPRNLLSGDPKQRFKELFEVQSVWELKEIVPFIKELNVKNVSMEKFVIKYARKRVEGKRILVMSR